MATNVSTTNHTGEDYATIAAWESDTEGALGGDIEELQIYNDDDSGIVTLSTIVTIAGATGTSATAYRKITAKSGDGWEGDCQATNPVTIHYTVSYAITLGEEYIRIDGIRFTGATASHYTFSHNSDNCSILRCFFDGRTTSCNCIYITGSTGCYLIRCLFVETGEYGFDNIASGGDNYVSNCTFYGGGYGISSWSSGRTVLNNSISTNATSDNFYADSESNWQTGTDYNISGSNSYNPTGNLLTSATAQATTTPTTGNRVMYTNLTASSEDFHLLDNADNDALEYGKTLTGIQAIDDPSGVSPSGTWDCGCFNLAVAGGVENDITISTSVDLNHVAEPQRHRDRVTGDTFDLNDSFILELLTSYVLNSVLISSDLSLNDGTGVQRWRDRIPSSSVDLGSTTWVQRERGKLLEDAVDLGTAIGQQLSRDRGLETSLDVLDAVDVQRQRDLLLSTIFDLEMRVHVARQLDRSIISALNLYDLLSVGEIEELFNFAVARDNVPTDTTTIEITTSNFGGDTPKAAIIVLTEAITNVTEATHNQLSIGFCDGSSQGYVRTQSVSGGASAVASRRFFSNAVMSRTTPGNTDAGITASFDSFITNGVRLTASSNYGAGYLVHAIFFGGSDCDVDVGVSGGHLSGNTIAVTDPGFEPDVVFFAYCSQNEDAADNINSSHSFGVAVNDGDETQRCVFHHASHGANPSVTQGGIWTESVLRHGNNENSELISFDTNGFTLEAKESSNPDDALYLAIKLNGGFFNLQTYTAPDSISTVSVNNLDFLPEALIMALMFTESVNTLVTSGGGGPFGVYMADGTDEYTAMVRDRDNVTPMESASRSQDKLRFDGHTGSSGYAATLTSFNTGGFTHNYTTSNNNNRLFWELALAGPDSARSRIRGLLTSLVVYDALSYTTLQFLLHSITLQSQLEIEDHLKVDREVMRLCESFVDLYHNLQSTQERNRQLSSNLNVYDDILQDAIKVLSDILLHDNLELTHSTIVAIQRLFKPIGVIIYGLDKARIEYAVSHGLGKIEYTLGHREGIVYRLHNIKGETIYHD